MEDALCNRGPVYTAPRALQHFFRGYNILLTHRHCYSVPFGVERVADFHQVTVAFRLVLDARRFHEERVPAFTLEYSVNALLIALGEHGRVRCFHYAPHPLVQTQVGFLHNI